MGKKSFNDGVAVVKPGVELGFLMGILKKYQLPITLILLISVSIAFGEHVPFIVKSALYAFSLTIKDILVLLLPFIIFAFLFHSLVSLKQRAILFVIMLLIMVAASNFLAIFTGYSVGSTVLPFLDLKLQADSAVEQLQPLWNLNIPKLISNEPAIIFGICMGTYFAIKPNARMEAWGSWMSALASGFLKKIFMPILPVFILGFVLKLDYEDMLIHVFHTYGEVLMIVVCTQVAYICFIYGLASGMRPKRMLRFLQNILPATITGFSTISSAATMPVTILCTEKNLDNPTFARMIVPATANIHTLGSAIGLTILALSTILAFGHDLPAITDFMIFAFYYTMAKFAVAGIPGGVIIVVAPLLESYLGFTSDMLGLVTAIYLLFDPFGTATNVTCNGAFAVIFNKIYKSQEFAQEIDEESMEVLVNDRSI